MSLSVKNMLGGGGGKIANADTVSCMASMEIPPNTFCEYRASYISNLGAKTQCTLSGLDATGNVNYTSLMIDDTHGLYVGGADGYPFYFIMFSVNEDLTITFDSVTQIASSTDTRYLWIRPRLFKLDNNTIMWANNGADNTPGHIDFIKIIDGQPVRINGFSVSAYDTGVYDCVNAGGNKWVVLAKNSNRGASAVVFEYTSSETVEGFSVSHGSFYELKGNTSYGSYLGDYERHLSACIDGYYICLNDCEYSHGLSNVGIYSINGLTLANGSTVSTVYEDSTYMSTSGGRVQCFYYDGEYVWAKLTSSYNSYPIMYLFKCIMDTEAKKLTIIKQYKVADSVSSLDTKYSNIWKVDDVLLVTYVKGNNETNATANCFKIDSVGEFTVSKLSGHWACKCAGVTSKYAVWVIATGGFYASRFMPFPRASIYTGANKEPMVTCVSKTKGIKDRTMQIYLPKAEEV